MCWPTQWGLRLTWISSLGLFHFLETGCQKKSIPLCQGTQRHSCRGCQQVERTNLKEYKIQLKFPRLTEVPILLNLPIFPVISIMQVCRISWGPDSTTASRADISFAFASWLVFNKKLWGFDVSIVTSPTKMCKFLEIDQYLSFTDDTSTLYGVWGYYDYC